MKNTGKPSEEIFDDYVASLGKRAFLYEFPDSAKINGQNKFLKGIRVRVPPTPSDRLLTLDGQTMFVEVKSTTNATRFGFSGIRPGQLSAAFQVTAAGGSYVVIIHSLHLNHWYWVPFKVISVAMKDEKKKSFSWEELEQFRWNL